MRYRTCNLGPSCNDYKITRYIFDILDRNADCPFPCVLNGHHFCRPPPCPVPACRDPISIPGQCCGTCPEDCPKGTCKIGNKTACYPFPCPLPPCVNPVTTPGDCCPHCPDGTYVHCIIIYNEVYIYCMWLLIFRRSNTSNFY